MLIAVGRRRQRQIMHKQPSAVDKSAQFNIRIWPQHILYGARIMLAPEFLFFYMERNSNLPTGIFSAERLAPFSIAFLAHKSAFSLI